MEISLYQIDILKELINIGVGRSVGMLNRMLRYHIDLQVPDVRILSPNELAVETQKLASEEMAAVEMGFSGRFRGTSALLFTSRSASTLVSVLLDGDPVHSTDLDMLRIGTLQEVGNIVLNGVMGSIGNILEETIDYSPPTFEEGKFENLVLSKATSPKATVLLAQTHFTIRQVLIEGDIVIVFEVGAFDALLSLISKMVPDEA
jgi:chemotaxis protein CheC